MDLSVEPTYHEDGLDTDGSVILETLNSQNRNSNLSPHINEDSSGKSFTDTMQPHLVSPVTDRLPAQSPVSLVFSHEHQTTVGPPTTKEVAQGSSTSEVSGMTDLNRLAKDHPSVLGLDINADSHMPQNKTDNQEIDEEKRIQINIVSKAQSPLQVKEEDIEVMRMEEEHLYRDRVSGRASEYTSRAVTPEQYSVIYGSEISQPRPGDSKQLDVSDALSYLDAVRQQFHDRPDVYNHFLDIMKDFKSQQIDTPGVIERVSTLFSGHPILIQGFNTFLPVGYRIECSFDAQDANLITVTTPSGTTIQSTGGAIPGQNSYFSTSHLTPMELDNVGNQAGSFHKGLASRAMPYTAEEIYPAVEYLTKIKQRFADQKELYQEFLDILSMYQNGVAPDESQMAARIAKLFQNAPDLLADFQHFMPQGMLSNPNVVGVLEDRDDKVEKSSRKKGESSGSTLSQKRKRKQTEKEREKEKERESTGKSSKSKKQKHQLSHQVDVPNTQYKAGPSSPSQKPYGLDSPSFAAAQLPPVPDDTMFFDRVRRFLDNRETYNEFLKLINLFTQDIIDMRQFVEQAYSFLGESELIVQLKGILGWDSRWDQEKYFPPASLEGYKRESGVNDRNSKASIKYGPSYRRLPASEINVTCSGHDEMCKSVLNDEYASHPTWASEDAGFVAHKKNVYEEALHRSEEERHEYDFHIEAIVRTIALLEPLNNRIMQMRPEEQANFKLKANLGGSSKSIHHRIIKKIYGREAGLEVIEAMHDAPSISIPVVLARLKQKEEEWKRAQREWNKVWREVDVRNYQKSLDHQGVTFKANDKKLITTKAFINQIEASREEQMARRASLIDPTFARTRPRYQLAFNIESESVLQDIVKLILSFVDRLQNQIGLAERSKIESFLRSFVPTFFMFDSKVFNAGVGALGDSPDSWGTPDSLIAGMDEDSTGNYSRPSRNGKRPQAGNDLRKRLLKNTAQEKSNRKTRSGTVSESSSRMTSPAIVDEPMTQVATAFSADEPMVIDKYALEQSAQGVDLGDSASGRILRKGVFFTNSSFYSLLRLIELMHSRLLRCKIIATKLAESSSSYLSNPLATELGLLDTAPPSLKLETFKSQLNPVAHYYEYLLECCEHLFDNELDQQTFEDIARYMFGTKAYVMFTVDKVIGAVIKQIQNILADSKSLTLLEGLRKEREMTSPIMQDHTNLRKQADMTIGPDENVYRIEWVPESKMITFQLLGKDENDPEVTTGRWQAYIDSFVSDKPSNGVPSSKVRNPFLRRNIKASQTSDSMQDVHGRSGLEIKVCVRTYRLFFVSRSEDFLWRDIGLEKFRNGVKRFQMHREVNKMWLGRLGKSTQ